MTEDRTESIRLRPRRSRWPYILLVIVLLVAATVLWLCRDHFRTPQDLYFRVPDYIPLYSERDLHRIPTGTREVGYLIGVLDHSRALLRPEIGYGLIGISCIRKHFIHIIVHVVCFPPPHRSPVQECRSRLLH